MEEITILEDEVDELLDEINRIQQENDRLQQQIGDLEADVKEKEDALDNITASYNNYISDSICDLSQYTESQIDNHIPLMLGNENIDLETLFSDTLYNFIPENFLQPIEFRPIYGLSDNEDYTLECSYKQLVNLIRHTYDLIMDECMDDERHKEVCASIFNRPSTYKALLLLDIMYSSPHNGYETLCMIDESNHQEYFTILNDIFFDKKRMRHNYIKTVISTRFKLEYDCLIALSSYFYHQYDNSGDFEDIFRVYIGSKGLPKKIKNAYKYGRKNFIKNDLWRLISTLDDRGIIKINESLANHVEFPRGIQNRINILKLKGEV